MKLNYRIVPIWTLLVAALALTPKAIAQEAVMAPPETKLTAPSLRESGPPAQSRPTEPAEVFFQFGDFSLHPHLLARYINGEGLPARNGRHVASEIYTLAPGLAVDAGKHWTFDYTPTWTTYTAPALEDTLAQNFRLAGAGELQDWAWNFSENFADSAPLLIETGGQTPTRTWATVLGANHSFSSKTGFQTTVSLNERYGEITPDTRDWANMNWLTRQLSPQAQFGLGLGGGYTDIVDQPDATNIRYMGRFNWSPTEKLKLLIDGGIETRQSRASGSNDMNNPIVTASLAYQPFATTNLNLSRSRTVSTSYFENQVVVGNGWNFSVEQRLLTHFYLSGSYSNQLNDYESLAPPVSTEPPPAEPAPGEPIVSLPGRSDKTESFNIRLTTQIFGNWTVAATYQHIINTSNQDSYGFDSIQYGVEVGCRF